MTIKTRLKKLEDKVSATAESLIDEAEIAKYHEDLAVYYAALGTAMNDYQTGTKTFVPKSPIPPPCYNAWRLQTYGPLATVADWPKFMIELRQKLAPWTSGSG